MQDKNIQVKNYYKILGVERTRHLTTEQITKAYKAKSLLLHPDKNLNDPEATRNFQELRGAFEILGTPDKKVVYDLLCDYKSTEDASAIPVSHCYEIFNLNDNSNIEDIDARYYALMYKILFSGDISVDINAYKGELFEFICKIKDFIIKSKAPEPKVVPNSFFYSTSSIGPQKTESRKKTELYVQQLKETLQIKNGKRTHFSNITDNVQNKLEKLANDLIDNKIDNQDKIYILKTIINSFVSLLNRYKILPEKQGEMVVSRINVLSLLLKKFKNVHWDFETYSLNGKDYYPFKEIFKNLFKQKNQDSSYRVFYELIAINMVSYKTRVGANENLQEKLISIKREDNEKGKLATKVLALLDEYKVNHSNKRSTENRYCFHNSQKNPRPSTDIPSEVKSESNPASMPFSPTGNHNPKDESTVNDLEDIFDEDVIKDLYSWSY